MAKPINIHKIRAGMIIIDCPECGYESEGFVGDPRGEGFICEGCNRKSMIDIDAKVIFN